MKWIVIVLIALAAPPALAQKGSAEAEQLFRDGKRLMKEGKLAEACAAFETSQSLDPAVSTLVNLADCREKNGQIASAWESFLEAERQTRGDDKQKALHKTAKERAAKLEPKLSYLTVSVPAESSVSGLELTKNGAPFAEGLWNRAIPVDGGPVTISGRAPGHEAWSTTVDVPAENGRVSVDVPRFKEVEVLMKEPEVVEDDEDDELIVEREPSMFTGKRKVAVALAGVGVLALGGGILFGLQAKGFEDDAYGLCPSNPCSGDADEADALLAKGQTRALLSNISFGAAIVAAAGATVLWLTGGPVSVTVDEEEVALAVGGTF